MAKFEINQAGMRRLERDIQKKASAAVHRGERAGQGKTPDQVADAVARELKRIGIEPDVATLRKQYRAAADGS